MLRYCILFSAIFSLVIIFAACGESSYASQEIIQQDLPGRIEMFFIYEETCASCDGTADFFALVNERLGDTSYPYVIETINIFQSEGLAQFNELAQDLLGVEANTLALPVLIINGLAFQGMNAIGDNLYEAFLTAGHDLFQRGVVFNPRYQRTGDELFADYHADPNNVTLVYFYRIVCPACQEIAPLIEQLPATVEIDGNQVPVDLITMNTRSGNNRDRVMAMFEAYQVPDQYRRVPIIFTASGFYTGPENIEQMLEHYLAQNDKIGFVFP